MPLARDIQIGLAPTVGASSKNQTRDGAHWMDQRTFESMWSAATCSTAWQVARHVSPRAPALAPAQAMRSSPIGGALAVSRPADWQLRHADQAEEPNAPL
jgi:hypothetical protein